MRTSWLGIFAAFTATASAATPPVERAPLPAPSSLNLTGKQGFDFLDGDWRARHHRISSITNKWVQFGGTVSHRALMAGSANIEEYVLDSPDGPYRALNLRAYDEKTDLWSIWWLDSRYPQGPIGPPVQGRFDNGIGTFYSDYEQAGKPMRMRFIWSDMTPTSARWQRAISADGGKTWETTWIIEVERARIAEARSGPKKSEFAFLDGEWQVQHRYLRSKHGKEWTDTAGTVSHREYEAGWANVEDYVIDSPGGPNYAVAMRSYDPKDRSWTIWWLDGRYPSSIEEPMRGRFENGVGTFHGATKLEGKPTLVRFNWSGTNTTSPRWRQDYSYDDGKTWETVWTMQFRHGG